MTTPSQLNYGQTDAGDSANPDTIDAAAVRAHIWHCRRRGLSPETMARLLGMTSRSHIAEIANGTIPRVTRSLAARILSVRPPVLPDTAWKQQGACADHPTDLFFPERGESKQAAAAKRICHTCPVEHTCLVYATTNHELGVWGGTTEEERRKMRPGLQYPRHRPDLEAA